MWAVARARAPFFTYPDVSGRSSRFRPTWPFWPFSWAIAHARGPISTSRDVPGRPSCFCPTWPFWAFRGLWHTFGAFFHLLGPSRPNFTFSPGWPVLAVSWAIAHVLARFLASRDPPGRPSRFGPTCPCCPSRGLHHTLGAVFHPRDLYAFGVLSRGSLGTVMSLFRRRAWAWACHVIREP